MINVDEIDAGEVVLDRSKGFLIARMTEEELEADVVKQVDAPSVLISLRKKSCVISDPRGFK